MQTTSLNPLANQQADVFHLEFWSQVESKDKISVMILLEAASEGLCKMIYFRLNFTAVF